jgi:hypothetical protein
LQGRPSAAVLVLMADKVYKTGEVFFRILVVALEEQELDQSQLEPGQEESGVRTRAFKYDVHNF